MTQCIMAMAHHEYLELEGGQQMIEFIVRQCALPSEPPVVRKGVDLDAVSNDQLRMMCANMLQLLSTTVPCMEGVISSARLDYGTI